MSEQLPKFLAVHFDGDFLEHAAFVESEQEWAQLTCLVSPGDHWDPVLIPIETAAAAPALLTACEKVRDRLGGMTYYTDIFDIMQSAIAKATGE